MDAQKEFFLKQIEQLHQNNKIRGSQDYMNYIGNNYEFLIQLVREQDELLTSHAPNGHNYTNGQYVWLQLENERLKSQLAKYERVVEAAKILIQKARDEKNATGDNGQPDWY